MHKGFKGAFERRAPLGDCMPTHVCGSWLAMAGRHAGCTTWCHAVDAQAVTMLLRRPQPLNVHGVWQHCTSV